MVKSSLARLEIGTIEPFNVFKRSAESTEVAPRRDRVSKDGGGPTSY